MKLEIIWLKLVKQVFDILKNVENTIGIRRL